MSSALPFVKSGKLQVLSIYVHLQFIGSIKAGFVFVPLSLSLLCIQQIGVFLWLLLLNMLTLCGSMLHCVLNVFS